jgi:NAD(P)-dependent dehydrogenase (short-subunit alcohol dehydrogenase family)
MTIATTSAPLIPEFNLTGKVAVVTGGNRSIGRGSATVLAEAGASVVLAGRNEDDLERVREEITKRGGTALAVRCDVSKEADVDNLFARAVAELGGVDICLVNAGVFGKWQSAELMEREEWDTIYEIDLRGAMLTSMAAGKHMITKGSGGSIVTIASIQGVVGIKGTVAYTSAKHGVVGMTKGLALDWAEHGIRVNCIAPAFIARDVEPLQQDPVAVEFVTTRTPLQRWGTCRELGLAVLFLASPASSYVTGTVLNVDGGWCAQ